MRLPCIWLLRPPRCQTLRIAWPIYGAESILPWINARDNQLRADGVARRHGADLQTRRDLLPGRGDRPEKQGQADQAAAR